MSRQDVTMSNEECSITELINELEHNMSSEPTVESLSDAINKLEEYIIQSRKENGGSGSNINNISDVKDEEDVWKRIIRAKELLEQLEHANEVLTNLCVAMQSVTLALHNANHTIDNNISNNNCNECSTEKAWIYFHAIHVANTFICKERLACNPLKARQVVAFTTSVLNKLQEAIVLHWMASQVQEKHKTHNKTHEIDTIHDSKNKTSYKNSTIEKVMQRDKKDVNLSLACILADMNVAIPFTLRDLCLDHVTSTIWRHEAKSLYIALCHSFREMVELKQLVCIKRESDRLTNDVMMPTKVKSAVNSCNETNSATEDSIENFERVPNNKPVSYDGNVRAKSESKNRDQCDECKVQRPAVFLHSRTILEEYNNKDKETDANYSTNKVNHWEGPSSSEEGDHIMRREELEENNEYVSECANRTNQSHCTHSFHKTHSRSKHKSHSVSSSTSRHHTHSKTLRMNPLAHAPLMESVESNKPGYIPPIINKAARLRAMISRRKTGIDDPRVYKLNSRQWRSNHRTRSTSSRNMNNINTINDSEYTSNREISINSNNNNNNNNNIIMYNIRSTYSYHTDDEDHNNNSNNQHSYEAEGSKEFVDVTFDSIDNNSVVDHYNVKEDDNIKFNNEEVEEELLINKNIYEGNSVIDECVSNLQLPRYNYNYDKEDSKVEMNIQANIKKSKIYELDPHALTQESTFTESGYITPTISPPSTIANFSSMEIKFNKPFTTRNNSTPDTNMNIPLATEHKSDLNVLHENINKTGKLPPSQETYEQERQKLEAEAEYEWKEIVDMANSEPTTIQTNKITTTSTITTNKISSDVYGDAVSAANSIATSENVEATKLTTVIQHERIYSGVSASTESDMPDFAMSSKNELPNEQNQSKEYEFFPDVHRSAMEVVSEVESIEYEDENNDKYSHTIYRDEANINDNDDDDDDDDDDDGIWLPRRWSDPGEFELAEVHTMRSEMSYEPSLRSTRYYNVYETKRRSPETEHHKATEYGSNKNMHKVENEEWKLHNDVMMPNENVKCNVVSDEFAKSKNINYVNNSQKTNNNCNINTINATNNKSNSKTFYADDQQIPDKANDKYDLNINNTQFVNNNSVCDSMNSKNNETIKGVEGISNLTEMLNELDQANQMALRHAMEKRPHRRRAVHERVRQYCK